ncbi:unnamed protein product [Caenorhabditis angaria]|uniref:Uncharacterized protein n=1 Tax=Caenorhabditis angaria TaxID=860376 RepID=A0A9P1IC89_9PELO|nr:unnamed protein product [Caenorhabditis angaria]
MTRELFQLGPTRDFDEIYISDLRKFLAPLFKALIELLLQPGEKGVEAKVGLYRSVRLILRTVFEPNCAVEAVHEAEDWLLDGHETPSSSNSDQIVEVVDLMSDDISRHLASSISDLPKHRKVSTFFGMGELGEKSFRKTFTIKLSLLKYLQKSTVSLKNHKNRMKKLNALNIK